MKSRSASNCPRLPQIQLLIWRRWQSMADNPTSHTNTIIISTARPNRALFTTAKLCFVDTVCWIALLNKADILHEQATSVYQLHFENGHHFLTTTAVLNETANALSTPR